LAKKVAEVKENVGKTQVTRHGIECLFLKHKNHSPLRPLVNVDGGSQGSRKALSPQRIQG
jgi:hypothetical protein